MSGYANTIQRGEVNKGYDVIEFFLPPPLPLANFIENLTVLKAKIFFSKKRKIFKIQVSRKQIKYCSIEIVYMILLKILLHEKYSITALNNEILWH